MIAFILIGSLFCLAGCAQLYKTLGLSDRQAADQVAADQTARQEIFQGIRLTTTELITTAIAGVGAIASGFLAKWLGTEKKITAALITGIEKADAKTAKQAVNDKANDLGVQDKLHTRVKSLT